MRSSAKPLSCGYRGTFSSPAPAVQAACSTDLDGCKRQCLTKTICKSFAFNTRKQTCTLYGKTLAAQDWSFTGTGAVRQYARQCFEYEVSRPGPNVVRNPSFEDDENYNPVNWNIQTISDEAPSTEGDFCSNIADDSSAYHGDNGLTSM